MCIHIPFFTTCDNSADIDAVKEYMKSQNAGIITEIDAFKATNNARMTQLIQTLSMSKIMKYSQKRMNEEYRIENMYANYVRSTKAKYSRLNSKSSSGS